MQPRYLPSPILYDQYGPCLLDFRVVFSTLLNFRTNADQEHDTAESVLNDYCDAHESPSPNDFVSQYSERRLEHDDDNLFFQSGLDLTIALVVNQQNVVNVTLIHSVLIKSVHLDEYVASYSHHTPQNADKLDRLVPQPHHFLA